MPRKPKNPLAFLSMRVTARDRAIFDAVCVRNQLQTEVAKQFGLSPQRISKIVARVSLWLSQPTPAGLNELPREDRLRYVSRRHVLRLESLRKQAEDAFATSRTAKHTVKQRWVKGELAFEERTVTTRDGDRRFIQEQADIEQRIVEFEGFDRYGNVDVSCQGRVYEVPKNHDNVVKRAVKKCVMNGELDTPGDEGIPGIWEQEMKMTNAKVAASSPPLSPNTPCSVVEVNQPRAAEAVSRDVNSPMPESRCADSGGMRLPTATTEHGVFGDNQAGDLGSDSSSPSKELLIENRHESSQDGEQQSVTTKTKAEKVSINAAVAAKPLKPLSQRLDYMRRPFTKPTTWPEPPPGKEWLQDPEYLYELGMQIHGYPIAPSLCQQYFPARRRSD